MLCRLILLALVAVLVAPLLVDAHSCPPCQVSNCPPASCVLGVAKDDCNCCSVCMRAVGEVCGGRFNTKGRCGAGLRCIKPPVAGVQLSSNLGDGTCKAVPTTA